MRQDWVFDVLADLRSFAARNGMVKLADQLEDTMIVAAADIAATAGPVEWARDDATNGNLHRARAGGNHA
ncbi:hypothetical protein CLV77_2929 [Brevirhabdus pacifica]|uniref:hypothetical protein n=1 Tax=Brevirhabdus pacifica TaxID=1267768 RepID=UPI000CB6FDCF|nr:hypothetical protein [Brevirhabdus pacifica]PJJ80658.1 hypothetical protein CLV77_2929 [Brevirhabdus pacifica]